MIDWRIARLDSPIQARLAEALALELSYFVTRQETLHVRSEFPISLGPRNIRADLALWVVSGPHTERLIVEADGKDFHDTIKDAARDHQALRAGWSTLRFTGAEIHRSASDCASKVSGFFAEVLDAAKMDAWVSSRRRQADADFARMIENDAEEARYLDIWTRMETKTPPVSTEDAAWFEMMVAADAGAA